MRYSIFDRVTKTVVEDCGYSKYQAKVRLRFWKGVNPTRYRCRTTDAQGNEIDRPAITLPEEVEKGTEEPPQDDSGGCDRRWAPLDHAQEAEKVGATHFIHRESLKIEGLNAAHAQMMKGLAGRIESFTGDQFTYGPASKEAKDEND